MMTNVLKEDGLYGEYCENSTDNTDSLQNLTSSISCAERDRLLGNINVASNWIGLQYKFHVLVMENNLHLCQPNIS